MQKAKAKLACVRHWLLEILHCKEDSEETSLSMQTFLEQCAFKYGKTINLKCLIVKKRECMNNNDNCEVI